MTIAEENADLKSQIEALTAAQEEGQGALATVGETNEKLEKANAALVEKVAQLENELADVKSEQQEVEEIAGERAAEIVAQQGAEPVAEETEEAAKPKTLNELWDEYSSIENLKERTVFYRENIKPLTK
jgi:chromosome segregation ATPase|tara:strand:- start:155 stop:541 length:387 start_codon:yes stop_codon:yes gene_type:complete